jgi:hypothetical protein
LRTEGFCIADVGCYLLLLMSADIAGDAGSKSRSDCSMSAVIADVGCCRWYRLLSMLSLLPLVFLIAADV